MTRAEDYRRRSGFHGWGPPNTNASLEMPKPKEIAAKQRDGLLKTLKARFDAHMHRHAGLEWTAVQRRLESSSASLWSLNEMEQSGGEPDVVGMEQATGECLFVDCSAQSPKGRRSVCYDRQALEARKEHKPKTSAVEMATAMGAALLTVDEYQSLQAARSVRYDHVQLGANTGRDPEARRRAVLRSPLRHGLRVPQRCRLLLCRSGVPLLAQSLAGPPSRADGASLPSWREAFS